MNPWTSIRSLAAGVLAAAILYVCFFSHLGTLGLVGPDEPRYAAVARAMAESGDWVTPRLNGKPWFEKPILYYWAAAAAFRAFGVCEFSARLPSALAAALTALLLAWAAARFYGRAASRAVFLIFPVCLGTFAFARAATTDMLFSASLAGAMVAAWQALPHAQRHPSRLWCLAFGAALGLATLAKGPAAIVLAAGSVALWVVSTRRWRDALQLAHPWSAVSFCLVALPWYVLCAWRNPEFAQTFLLAHNVERYLTPVFKHEQPVWFFGPVLLLALLPWTILLPGIARDAVRAWRQDGWKDSPSYFFAFWVIFTAVFFSLSQSKLPSYILPSLPPLALLFSRTVTQGVEQEDSFVSLLLSGVGVTCTAVAISASHWLKRLPPGANLDAERALPWLIASVAVGLCIAVLGLLRRPRAALVISAILVASLVEVANRQFIPQLDPSLSARAAAQVVQDQPTQTAGVWVYRLHRAWRYGLNFYFGRELPEWMPGVARPAWIYTNPTGIADLERQGIKPEVFRRFQREVVLARLEPKGR